MDNLDETQNSASDTSQEATDAITGASSDPKDATGGSSTATGAKEGTPTLSDALNASDKELEFAEGGDQEDVEQASEDSPTKADAQPKSGEGADADKGGKDEPADAQAKPEDSANVPFHKHRDWSELTKALGEDGAKKARPILRRALEREQHLSRQVEELRPNSDLVAEFKQYAGDEQGFTVMRNIIKAYSTEPERAVPILEQMLTDARQRAGLEVTSQDLKRKLEMGEVDEDTAKMIEQERAKAKRLEQKLTVEQRQAQERQQRQAGEAMANALNAWEQNIRERDPDFGDVENPDSVCKEVFDAIRLYRIDNPNSTPQQIVAEAQKSYRKVKSRLGTGTSDRTQRVLKSTDSSVTAKAAPRTPMEAMNNAKLTFAD